MKNYASRILNAYHCSVHVACFVAVLHNNIIIISARAYALRGWREMSKEERGSAPRRVRGGSKHGTKAD